jgi:hypothetical protein
MKANHDNLLWRAAIPAVIGIGVAAWLFHDEFQNDAWREIVFNANTVIALILALLFVAGRDFGLTWRFHTLTDGDLSWARALRVDLMCAFTSAITPSAVGGSALAIFYLNREGISVGRATTLTLTTLFLDELFFVIFCPIIFLLLPVRDLFSSADHGTLLASIQIIFWLVYAGICVWTFILYMGIIARPRIVGRTFIRVFSIKWLRRWRRSIYDMTENMATTAAWVKGKPLKWWMNIFGATVLSWFSRYFIVNSLFYGFVPDASGLLVFGRQFVVWVVLMVSPTPGGSGISEWLFANYYGDLIGNISIALILALIWRVLSYYNYLVIGACLVPSYFRRNNKKLKSK